MRLRAVLLAVASLMPRAAFSMTSEEFLQLHRCSEDGLAPLYGTDLDTKIPDQYIVMFRPGYTLQEHFETIGIDLSTKTGFDIYQYGYSAEIDNATLNSNVRPDPGVLFIETDRPVYLIEPVDQY